MSEDQIQVLVIEDDRDYAHVLQLMLSSIGSDVFSVQHVDRLQTAKKALENQPFDVALLDLSLPDSKGFQTYQQLANHRPETPIIVLTVLDDEELTLRAIRSGAQDYLIKGKFDGALLVRALRYAIERHRTVTKLQQLSYLDELTGLFNRRGFFSLARQQMEICQRSGRSLLLFFADMDGLKRINDTYGHSEGDQALSRIAQILLKTFRASDIIGRIGGDEFAILAVDTEASPEILLKRLEGNLQGANQNGDLPHLSLSIGASRYDPRQTPTLEDLLSRADQALYEEKRLKSFP